MLRPKKWPSATFNALLTTSASLLDGRRYDPHDPPDRYSRKIVRHLPDPYDLVKCDAGRMGAGIAASQMVIGTHDSVSCPDALLAGLYGKPVLMAVRSLWHLPQFG